VVREDREHPADAGGGDRGCLTSDEVEVKVEAAAPRLSVHTSRSAPAWPVAFALTELTDAEEARISELLKKAVS
jgi:hypothetical protein